MSEAETIKPTPLVLKDSPEDLVNHRNRALELMAEGLRILREADAVARMACPHDPRFLHLWDSDMRGVMWSTIEENVAACARRLDAAAWRDLHARSGMGNLMDTRTSEQFVEQLNKKPPEFTIANIEATFETLRADAEPMFLRSIITIFERLNTRHYKTNSAFRMTPRVILTGGLSPGRYGDGWSHYGFTKNLVADLDRAFHILDKQRPPAAGNAADAIGYAHAKGEKTCQTKYFSARMFRGNGNLHLKLLREDLVDEMNQMIAAHYGTVLPNDHKEVR